MRAIKDEAICIRTHTYSESSQIVTLFSQAHGKIRAMAKGSRRAKGKFSGGIELLSVADVIFTPPPGQSALAALHEYELKQVFNHLRSDLIAINCATYCAEMLGEFTEDFDAHDELYVAFKEALAGFDLAGQNEANLVKFEKALLQEVGLAPIWDQCSSCRISIVDQLLDKDKRPPVIYFSSRNGGVVCRDCEPAIVEKRRISNRVLKLFLHSENLLNADRRDVMAAHDLLSYHQREILGKQTRMTTFLNRLLNQQVK